VWLQVPKAVSTVQRLVVAPADQDHQKINIGLQLYSVRNQMAKDVPGTLRKVHDFGITDVESAGFYGESAEQFRQQLDAAGLHASGGHWQWNDFSDHLDQVIKDARTIGAEYVTLPWIPHNGNFTLDEAHKAAAKFNEWGRKCSEAGLHFCYHPHGYEFKPTPQGTAFDVLVRETDPKYANFELDIFWAYHGGADP